MRGIPATLVTLVLGLSGCFGESDPEAIIHVQLVTGEAPVDRYDMLAQQESLRSFRYLGQVSKKLDLPGKWQLNESEAIERLRKAISVRLGDQPDLLVVRVHGTEREQAIDVLEALCEVAVADKHVIEGRTAGDSKVTRKELHFEVVQQAK